MLLWHFPYFYLQSWNLKQQDTLQPTELYNWILTLSTIIHYIQNLRFYKKIKLKIRNVSTQDKDTIFFPINSFIMLWDNIYKPYCASTAAAAFWRQRALKTWQNISFLTIIKDNKIHLPLVLQPKASNNIFLSQWFHRYTGQLMSLELAQNTWWSKHVLRL